MKTLRSVFGSAVIAMSCAHQELPSEPTTQTTPPDAPPKTCAQLFGKVDTCTMLRNLIDARARPADRVCLDTIAYRPPGHHWHCSWQSFAKRHVEEEKTVGVEPDCYADRFTGEGVICTLEDNEHPQDGTTYFDATEADIRKCLDGWSYERKASTKRLGDRAFSFSKALDPASPALVTTRVQGCRETTTVTDDATGVATGEQTFMRLEVFAESR